MIKDCSLFSWLYSGVALRCTAEVEQATIENMFWVYAIYNQDCKKYYVGQTYDLHKRLLEHNNHTYKSYTSRFPGEWELIYKESVPTRPEALTRERQLKSGNGREYIKSLVKN